MIKKTIFILLAIFTLCGCEAVYNLDISDVYNESIIITPENEKEINTLKFEYEKGHYTAFMKDDFDPEFTAPTDVEYYNKKLSDNNSLTLSYDFKKNNFGDSRAANTCYPSFLFIEGKYLRLNTIADFDCYEDYPGLTKVTINITVNYNVHNHNADSVNGNTYTWIIKPGQLRALNLEYENPDYKDSDNGGSSNIDVDPDKENKNDKKENNNASTKEQDEQAFKFVLILTGLFFALLFVIIFFRKKLNL